MRGQQLAPVVSFCARSDVYIQPSALSVGPWAPCIPTPLRRTFGAKSGCSPVRPQVDLTEYINMFKVSRLLIIYAIAIPLACFVGLLAVAPGQLAVQIVGLLLFFLALPVILKWHHSLMIVLWNSVFIAVFLPGGPAVWIPLAALSFGISMLNHIMFQKRFLRAPELTRPLLCLVAVVLVTAELRGGIGIRALGGGAYGGKKYAVVLMAVAGYFALTSERISIDKGRKMVGWFFASGISHALINVAFMLGPLFYFVYFLVPSGEAASQARAEYSGDQLIRISSLAPASVSACTWLLSQYGIRGLLDSSKPWRFILFAVAMALGFLAGFRGMLLLLAIVCAIQFYLEGLIQTKYLPILAGLAMFCFIPMVLFAKHMPGSVQRVISFLPVNVNSEILQDAENSTEWRLDMWKDAGRDVPKYLVLGKGYALDPALLAYVTLANINGVTVDSYEGSLVASDFHNGLLSILIPFGLPGLFVFLWILHAGYRVLSWNYRYGDARLRGVNRTLLAYYLSFCIAFFVIFGAFADQLYVFLGILGLSVSINAGVKRKVAAPKPAPVAEPDNLVMEPG